jgi:hypothetical protein
MTSPDEPRRVDDTDLSEFLDEIAVSMKSVIPDPLPAHLAGFDVGWGHTTQFEIPEKNEDSLFYWKGRPYHSGRIDLSCEDAGLLSPFRKRAEP